MNRKALSTLIFDLFLLTCIFILFLSILIPSFEQHYTASLLDKVERIKSIEEPKLVLIGNSNLAFGIDSQQLEEAIGMPVVNMGLHGGLGNAFHEEMATLNVTPGDIYIICHTSYSDEGIPSDPSLLWITIENHKELWPLLRTEDIPGLVNAFPDYLKKCATRWGDGDKNKTPNFEYYNRSVFNLYGDVSKSRENYQLSEDELNNIQTNIKPEINNICIDRLNKLNEYLSSNGATMLVAGYPILVSDQADPDFANYIESFEQNLQESLDCRVISEYKDYFYTMPYFFDTTYHLNDEGVRLRTEQLIADLNAYLNRL